MTTAILTPLGAAEKDTRAFEMCVYYAAPGPGAEPFVKPGQKIAKGADLCIIEVMKVMNNIKAPFAGVVVDIAAKNGAMVEAGQALMWIKPEGQA